MAKIELNNVVQLIRSGKDKEALNVLYKKALPVVWGYIKRNNGNWDDAKDVFQETVVVLYFMVKNNDKGDIADIGGYLFTVARNKWLNKIRKNSPFQSLESINENQVKDESIAERILQDEKIGIVNELIEKLGGRCKELLNYYYYKRLSMREIAVQMSLANEDVAKSSHYKCKARLLELAKENGQLSTYLRW